MTTTETWSEELHGNGFLVLPRVFTLTQVDDILAGLTAALQVPTDESIRTREGTIYAARNVLALWPAAADVWRQSPLPEVLTAVLGLDFGLVRGLFFDKPPERSWALPWHKDVTIAVRDNRLPSRLFAKPTVKASVPHVEAPREVLDAMLTARIHLDDVTEENGPLKVLPGSHRTGTDLRLGDAAPYSVLGSRGDVLLMRPLLAHSSGNSQPDTQRHRRILHLEFAASPDLPDGYAWHDFIPGRA